ncbi:MAG TPA: acyl-ACP--UDP-N-acetylglucosamine O-acyltransferase [Woeseiaceae bacterium]
MIHQTAVVSNLAEIADGVEIGPYSVIGDRVRVGRGTRIGSHVVIKGPTTIGEDNRIYQFSSIGDDPQDKKFGGEDTRLEIGDRNTIREYCTINRGTAQDEGITSVGNDNWILAYVHIAHDCRVGSHTIFSNNATLAGHVHVGDWVIFAGFSGAHQFCHVGAHSFLGMFAGTSRDVPAYTMVAGQPATVRGINLEGLKRRNFTPSQISNIKNAYRVVYRKGMKLNDAIREVEELAKSRPELEVFAKSLHTSDRGLLR